MFSSNISENYLFETAIKNNDSELVEILMKYGGHPDNPALNQAMQAKDYYSVKILIEYGVDINSRSTIPIRENIENSQKEFNLGMGKTVLEMAISDGYLDMINYSLFKGADPTNKRSYQLYSPFRDIQGRFEPSADCTATAIYDAILLGRVDILKMFNEYEIELNPICYKSRTRIDNIILEYSPIQIAIKLKKKSCVEFLLSIGVDV